MTAQEFEEIKQKFLNEMSKKLAFKRDEYANNEDVLQNFRKGANISGEPPIEVLRMYALKHEVSLNDIFTQLANGGTVPEELFLEKATDFANYLVLAFAMLKELEK